MTEEQYCHGMLDVLRQSYERDAKRYIDKLAAIERLRATRPIVLMPTQATAFGETLLGALKRDAGGAGAEPAA